MKYLKPFAPQLFMLFMLASSPAAFSQNKEIIYVDDVNTIEYLWLRVGINKDGKVIEVLDTHSRTTYKNRRKIRELIKLRRTMKEPAARDGKTQTRYFYYCFYLVNSKYETMLVEEGDCESVLTRGTFKHTFPGSGQTIVERREGLQTETQGAKVYVLGIKWITPCTYELTRLAVPMDKDQSGIGKSWMVHILEVLPDGSYVYYYKPREDKIVFGELRRIQS